MAALTEQSHEAQPKKRNGFDTELKRRLVDHLDVLKRPNDIVRVTQVTNHHFRVNTMTPVRDPDAVVPVYQITKSQFLHVENKTGELVISDQTRHN
jgi:hypothetical protein